jgi:hypothetical protein
MWLDNFVFKGYALLNLKLEYVVRCFLHFIIAPTATNFCLFSLTQLHQLILAIHAQGESPDNSLETYTFNFTYKGDDLSSCSILRKDNKTNE